MFRRARAKEAAGQAPPPAPQIEEDAINTCGWSMKVPNGPWTEGLVILNAHEPSSTPWFRAAEAAGGKGETVYRSSLELSSRETSKDGEDGLKQYVIVGFTWPGLDEKKYGVKHPNLKKQQPVGRKVLPNSLIDPPDSCPTPVPILVVAQVVVAGPGGEAEANLQAVDDSIKLYALIRPSNGLCRPHVVNTKTCFYLARFRDDTTDLKSRGRNWNKKVLETCIRVPDVALSAKQERYKKARNTSKVVLEPLRALDNELACLSECYAVSGDTWFLQELKTVLETADEDLKDTPPPQNQYMRKFVDQMEREWDDEDSNRMMEELCDMWPDAFGDTSRNHQSNDNLVTIERLTLVKRGLDGQGQDVHLEYHLLRPFVLAACFDLQQQQEAALGVPSSDGSSTGKAEATILNCFHRTKTMLGQRKSGAPIPAHLFVDAPASLHLLRAIREALHKLVDTSSIFDKAMKDSVGDQTNRGTVQDVWEKYADALDTDAAKKSWMELARVAAYASKNRGVSDMVGDIVEILDRLNLEEAQGDSSEQAGVASGIP